jgi:hypothetical protein
VDCFFPACTLEETAALFDGVKVRRGIMRQTSDAVMTLARMPYPRPQDSRRAVQISSSASRSHFGSHSEESAVAFVS